SMQLEIDKVTDICSGKHRGNDESRSANRRSLSSRGADRDMVLSLIMERPRTMKEIAVVMGRQLNCVSGRASELKKLGCIEPTGEVRCGSAVLKAVILG